MCVNNNAIVGATAPGRPFYTYEAGDRGGRPYKVAIRTK